MGHPTAGHRDAVRRSVEESRAGAEETACDSVAGTAEEARGGGATIAEELFAEGLLKLVEIVPSLPSLGRKNKWDYEAPERILYYLTRAVKSGIYDCYRAASRFRGPPKEEGKYIVRALKKRKPREYRTTIYKEARGNSDGNPEWLYDGNTRYVLQCDRTGIAAMEEQEYMQWAIDQVCHDVKDRPLLWMKEEGIFTDGEIGEVLELKDKQIRKRLRRMRKELEDLFELRRRKCDKDRRRTKRTKRKRNAASGSPRTWTNGNSARTLWFVGERPSWSLVSHCPLGDSFSFQRPQTRLSSDRPQR